MLERGSAVAFALIIMLAGDAPAAAAMVTINTNSKAMLSTSAPVPC